MISRACKFTLIRKELKYFLSIVSIFSFSIYFLLLLLKKYSTLTFEHFLQTCKVIASNFFSTGAHYVGLILTVLVLVITLGLFLITLLSYVKTQRKLKTILESRIFSIPKKLKIILERNEINNDSLVIVNDEKEYALTINWFSPKIIISSNLIARLSRKQVEAVILHEYYHLKNKHPFLLITSEILASSLPLLPVLRDLTRKLRTVIEQEADTFVTSHQKTRNYLEMALVKVAPKARFSFYPSFSKRNDYSFKKSSVFVSMVAILIAFSLFKLPLDSHATQLPEVSNSPNCDGNQCSTHCISTNIFESYLNMSPAFQTSLFAFDIYWLTNLNLLHYVV